MVASSTMDHYPQSLASDCPQTIWSVTQRNLKVYWVTRTPSSFMTGTLPGRVSTLSRARAETTHMHHSNTLSGHAPRSAKSTRTALRNLLLQSSIWDGVMQQTHLGFLRPTQRSNCKYKTFSMVLEPYLLKRGCPHAFGTTRLSTTVLEPTSRRTGIASQLTSCGSHKRASSNMNSTPSAAWFTLCKPKHSRTTTRLPSLPPLVQPESC